MWQEDSEKTIEAAMVRLRPARLGAHIKRAKRLTFNLTDEEFHSIQEAAERLGISISDYFCALHRYASPRLEKRSDEENWTHPKEHSRVKSNS